MTAWKDDGKEHSNKCKRHPEQNFMTPHSNARTKEYFKFAKNANFPGPAAQRQRQEQFKSRSSNRMQRQNYKEC